MQIPRCASPDLLGESRRAHGASFRAVLPVFSFQRPRARLGRSHRPASAAAPRRREALRGNAGPVPPWHSEKIGLFDGVTDDPPGIGVTVSLLTPRLSDPGLQ